MSVFDSGTERDLVNSFSRDGYTINWFTLKFGARFPDNDVIIESCRSFNHVKHLIDTASHYPYIRVLATVELVKNAHPTGWCMNPKTMHHTFVIKDIPLQRFVAQIVFEHTNIITNVAAIVAEYFVQEDV
jgi:hypothetical protein